MNKEEHKLYAKWRAEQQNHISKYNRQKNKENKGTTYKIIIWFEKKIDYLDKVLRSLKRKK